MHAYAFSSACVMTASEEQIDVHPNHCGGKYTRESVHALMNLFVILSAHRVVVSSIVR